MSWRHTVIVCLVCLGVYFAVYSPLQASEGAFSYYFPGAFASFGVAVAPDPGFVFLNQTLYYHAEADLASKEGRLATSLEGTALMSFFGGAYTLEDRVLGGRLQFSAAAPLGYVSTKADITLQTGLGTFTPDVSDHNFNVGDSFLSGALAWDKGDFHFKIGEVVFIPTGAYSTNDLANIGRNYWAFDTSCAVTWLSTKTGTEVSVMPGILFNIENPDTDYKTGNEFHVDYMVNQFLAKSFAIGAQGYYYKQVTGDSGDGKPSAIGDFKGESYGFGPALLWMPGGTGGKLSVIAKWLFDSHHENRMKGDYGQLFVVYKFK